MVAPPVPNVPRNRSCHEQGRSPGDYGIIRDVTRMKQQIILEIQRLAEQNGGETPNQKKFWAETGISTSGIAKLFA